MGAYLSQPKTVKVSTDELNDNLIVGASSMQGWRNSQEDAHNSILNFDGKTSFFAVYDGHGGAEVATYCADKLPQYLKDLESYKNGNLEQALKNAFLGFDKTLLDSAVIEILKILAGEKNVDPEDSDEDEENLAELHKESHLPLNEVLKKYKDMPQTSSSALNRIENSEKSKPISPYLRGRRTAAIVAESTNKAVLDPDAKPQGSSTSAAAALAASASRSSSSIDAGPSTSKTTVTKIDQKEPEEDSTVSSSSSSGSKSNNSSIVAIEDTEAEAATTEKQNIINTNTNGSAITIGAKKFTTPDSSHIKESEQNGNVTSSEADVVKDGVSTSSTATAGKTVNDDAIVSGSNDAAECKQNGSVGSSTSHGTKNNVRLGEDEADNKLVLGEDDDSDFDYQAENNDDNEMCYALDENSSTEDECDEEEKELYDGVEDEEEDEECEEEEEIEDDDDAIANEQFCANMIEEPGKDSGCTAVVALLEGRDLYVANAGDSRCVVCRNGKAIEMSYDHKPEDYEESSRIIKAGGRVTLDGRVNGGLNLSRAIGDHAYKMNVELAAEEQMISALPDIKKLIITPEDEFMVLACDGIWNFMTSEEVVDFVRLRMKDETKQMSKICEELFDHCLAPNTFGDGTGCDNMTAVIVRFKPKLQEEESKINPNETEDLLLAKQAVEADIADENLKKILKRSASPTSNENSNECDNANKTKRLKTEDEASTSTIKTTNNNNTTTTTTNTTTISSNNSNTNSNNNSKSKTCNDEPTTSSSSSSTNSTTTTTSTTTNNDAQSNVVELKECDSVTTATIETNAATT